MPAIAPAPSLGPAAWRWIQCCCCGRKLARGQSAARVLPSAAAHAQFEIKCHSCGQLNYLAPLDDV